jgi:type I restriction enzyme S subunit
LGMTLMKGWKTNGLPELLRLMKSGGTPDTTRTDFYGGNIPFVSIEDMTATNKYLDSTTKTLTDDGLQHSNAWIVPENSILYSIYATLGLPRINTIPVATNQAILALIIDPNRVDLDYLYYWLDFIRSCVVSLSSQTTQNNLNATIVRSFLVDHPTSVAEQSQIADILSTVDLAIEQTEALIAKQQRIKTGLMQDLLTRGIDEHGNLRSERTHQFKDSPLGRIPSEWEVKSLGSALHETGGCLRTGPFGSQLHAHEYVTEGVPVIMPQDIVHGQVQVELVARVTETKAQTMTRYRVQSNDVVFSRRGDLSRAAAMSEREQGWLCGTGCFMLRVPANRMDAQWLAHAYRYELVQRQIEASAVGSMMPSLNNAVMESLLIAFPECEEQREIASRISTVDLVIQNRLIQCNKLHSLKTALMQDLLTGKVRVTPLLDNEEVSSE